ncbi:enolase-phosphatase E1 isoform X1 [Tachysurus vachellii]|uniref:enolase-phosphatase E1 isoform X1 n=3 Tax=Tachysurus vachellii TaxID=175792 RepID=UPI00296B44BA|nr:enolase-phosphatase E1 isoform X1 [Tachysurus vachellii]XP_060736667.1 enolase-phosphatase E1 isoform X1 [Tachysurus vachellii]
MEQNIVDLLKDAFSEIDFEHPPSDEDTNTSQTALVMDEDVEDVISASKLWTSEQGSDETFTTVYEQEENEASSDICESESSVLLSINTQATYCFSHDEINNDRVVNMMMAEAQQLNHAAGECTAEEGNMQSDIEADVSEKDLTEEEHIETLNVEYEPQMSPPMSRECQTPEEMSSSSDEELPKNYRTTRSESVDKKEESFLATSPNIPDKNVKDDMKEFTEEDQEHIEESLADYPSDLSHSESEEPAENATAQPFTQTGLSSSDNHTTDMMEEVFNAEHVNLQNKDSPDLDYNSGIKGVEVELISASVDVDLSFQRGSFDEDDVQESLTNDIKTEEDVKNMEDAGDLSDVSDQTDNISDSSSDDKSSSRDETEFLSSLKQEEEKNHVTQYNYSTEDMLRMDNDIGYICKNTGDLDAFSPEKKDVKQLLFWESGVTNPSSISCYEESSTELRHSIEPVQSDTALKDHEVSSTEASDNVEDTKNAITEVLWTSSLLMDEDNLHIEEYDWDLTGEDSFVINSVEGENQENEEDLDIEEFDIDDNEEGNERDWELEKTRIEAFYQFYGDQAEPDGEVGRNPKVSFLLDQESSSSEREEDSDSTEEELDSDLNIPDLNTSKPEYHSESDDDPLENPYYIERSKLQPKEQQPMNVPVKQPPQRNKCLAVLKSTLAFGLLTAIGIVSFWWATENMEWSN